MQLIWISGSTSSMKQIKITRKTVIKIALLSFSVFILIGMSIHFFGFRVAIRFNPEMAKQMGGGHFPQGDGWFRTHLPAENPDIPDATPHDWEQNPYS